MAAKKNAKQILDSACNAEEQLKTSRKIRLMELDLKATKAKLEVSERECESLRKRSEALDSLASDGPVDRWLHPKRKKHGDATAIICLSDLHVEKSVRKERTCGLNEYTLEIAEKRLKSVFDRAILLVEDARNLVSINSIVIWIGGDVIESHLRDENLSDNHLYPMEACRWACDRLESGIRQVAECTNAANILVATNHGNHGRSWKKMPAGPAAETSYEYNMYLELRRRFDNRFSWQISESYFNFAQVYDYVVRFHHGDRIKYGGGINGIGVPAYRFIANANTKKRAYLDIFGHFHSFAWPGPYVCNGSLVGVDEYSLAFGGDSVPRQAFVVIDKNRGTTRALPIFAE